MLRIKWSKLIVVIVVIGRPQMRRRLSGIDVHTGRLRGKGTKLRDNLPSTADMRRIVWSDHRRKRPLPEYAEIYADLSDKLDIARTHLVRARPEKADVYSKELSSYMSLKEQSEKHELEALCEIVSQQIVTGKWDTRLRFRTDANQRLITEFKSSDPIHKYLDRYISLLLRRFFQVQIPSRDQCIRTTRDYFESLKPPCTQFLLRTDVSHFFASIKHDFIKTKLRANTGVPSFVIDYVETLLENYEKAVGTNGYGIPAGVPISATLAEISLEHLDLWARQHPRIGLYIRYVDDILISSDKQTGDSAVQQIKEYLQEVGLELTTDNARNVQIMHPHKDPTELDFLGYSFCFSKAQSEMTTIDLSHAKTLRYEEALDRIKTRALSDYVCWASLDDLELFIRQIEVLILPHEHTSSRSYSRVIAGLAYSARFVRCQKGTRFEKLVRHCRGLVMQIKNTRLRDPVGTRNTNCQHCGKPAQPNTAVSSLLKSLDSAEKVLTAQPIAVSNEARYRQIKELVWNS